MPHLRHTRQIELRDAGDAESAPDVRLQRVVSAASIRSPLSGPIRTSPRPVFKAIGSRSVPTPGSTTATWVPIGMWGRAKTRLAAPSRIENRGT